MSNIHSTGVLTIPAGSPSPVLFKNVDSRITSSTALTVTLQNADNNDANNAWIQQAIPQSMYGGSILVYLAGTPVGAMTLAFQAATPEEPPASGVQPPSNTQSLVAPVSPGVVPSWIPQAFLTQFIVDVSFGVNPVPNACKFYVFDLQGVPLFTSAPQVITTGVNMFNVPWIPTQRIVSTSPIPFGSPTPPSVTVPTAPSPQFQYAISYCTLVSGALTYETPLSPLSGVLQIVPLSAGVAPGNPPDGTAAPCVLAATLTSGVITSVVSGILSNRYWVTGLVLSFVNQTNVADQFTVSVPYSPGVGLASVTSTINVSALPVNPAGKSYNLSVAQVNSFGTSVGSNSVLIAFPSTPTNPAPSPPFLDSNGVQIGATWTAVVGATSYDVDWYKNDVYLVTSTTSTTDALIDILPDFGSGDTCKATLLVNSSGVFSDVSAYSNTLTF